MRITQPDHATPIGWSAIGMIYGEQTKIMVAVTSKRMKLIMDGESTCFQKALGTLNQIVMRNWLMRNGELSCSLVWLLSVSDRRSHDIYHISVIDNRTITAHDVKVNSVSGNDLIVFCVIHSFILYMILVFCQ